MIRPITAERPLKILSFTDMHLDGNDACAGWTLRLMEKTVAAEAPDLVILAGDNVTGGNNRGRAEQLASAMTALGVPWCPILGNHEGDNPFAISRREMARIFRTSPCCLMPAQPAVLADGGMGDGETNYAVTLTGEDGRPCFRLIFLDVGSDMAPADVRRFGLSGETRHLYDYVKESQIAWYREQAAGCRRRCSATSPCRSSSWAMTRASALPGRTGSGSAARCTTAACSTRCGKEARCCARRDTTILMMPACATGV